MDKWFFTSLIEGKVADNGWTVERMEDEKKKMEQSWVNETSYCELNSRFANTDTNGCHKHTLAKMCLWLLWIHMDVTGKSRGSSTWETSGTTVAGDYSGQFYCPPSPLYFVHLYCMSFFFKYRCWFDFLLNLTVFLFICINVCLITNDFQRCTFKCFLISLHMVMLWVFLFYFILFYHKA